MRLKKPKRTRLTGPTAVKQEGGGQPASREVHRAGRGGLASLMSGCGDDSHSINAHKNLLVFIKNGHPGPH